MILALVGCTRHKDSDSSTTPTATPTAAVEVSVTAGAEGTPGPGGSATPDGSATPSVSGGAEPAECETATDDVGLISQATFNKDSGLYTTGEIVDITLILVNCGDNKSVLHYPTSQRVDFIITDPNSVEVWRSSDGEAFDQVVSEETIEPHEKVTYTESWDQKDSGGVQAADGQYKVSVFSVGCIASAREDCEFGPVRFIQIASPTPELTAGPIP